MKFTFFLLLFFLSFESSPQQHSVVDYLSPYQVVSQYVSVNGFPDKLKYFCCELYQEWDADSTLGQHLPKNVLRSPQLIFQDSTLATVAVWLHDSVLSVDVYFYLIKKKVWTIYAARSLVMKAAATNELNRLDSIPINDRGRKYKKNKLYSFDFEYENLKLWNASDSVLANYFRSHKKIFFKLHTVLAQKGFLTNDSLVVNGINNKKIRKLADRVLIRNFEYDKMYPGCIFFLIGGLLDNTVGYLYQPNSQKLPLLTEKQYILIKSLGSGWYLFKTT